MLDLVHHAQEGDPDAFTELVAGSVDRLHGAAFLVLRDRSMAEDAVQEGLLRAWRELPTLREADRFETWLKRIVVRQALDHARRRSARPMLSLLEGHAPTTYGEADLVVIRDALARAFSRLTPEHRAVLVLRHYLTLTVPEIAEILDLPAGTAKSRLHHAARAMRSALEADERATERSRTA
jgi:RNA polymerase sigma-70 factor (ECF subfamily)